MSGACASSRPRCAPIWWRAAASKPPPSTVRQTPVRSGTSIRRGCLDKAQAAGADYLLIMSFHKMSTLVEWAKFDIVSVKTRNVVFNKLVEVFRGDNDKAWRHAESFIVKEILDHAGAREATRRPSRQQTLLDRLDLQSKILRVIRHCARLPAMNHRPGWPVRTTCCATRSLAEPQIGPTLFGDLVPEQFFAPAPPAACSRWPARSDRRRRRAVLHPRALGGEASISANCTQPDLASTIRSEQPTLR